MEGLEWIIVPAIAGILLWAIPTQGPKMARALGRLRVDFAKGKRDAEKEYAEGK